MFENFGKKKNFGSLGFFCMLLACSFGSLGFFHVACLVRFAMHNTRDVIGMCVPAGLNAQASIHPGIAPV